MLTKEDVFRIIELLPDRFTADELINKLLFLEKVQKGLRQSQNGETMSKEQAMKKLKTIN